MNIILEISSVNPKVMIMLPHSVALMHVPCQFKLDDDRNIIFINFHEWLH